MSVPFFFKHFPDWAPILRLREAIDKLSYPDIICWYSSGLNKSQPLKRKGG